MKIRIMFFLIILSFLIWPSLSLAEDYSVVDYKKNPCLYEGDCGLEDMLGLVIGVSNYFLGIVGSLALLMFVIGGVVWITSGGASDKVELGKKIIVGAVIGIVIVFSAFLLIKVLEDVLGVESEFRPEEMRDNSKAAAGAKEGDWCGDNQRISKGRCLTKCEIGKGVDWSCQNPQGKTGCQDGLCPAGEDNKCCHNS